MYRKIRIRVMKETALRIVRIMAKYASSGMEFPLFYLRELTI